MLAALAVGVPWPICRGQRATGESPSAEVRGQRGGGSLLLQRSEGNTGAGAGGVSSYQAVSRDQTQGLGLGDWPLCRDRTLPTLQDHRRYINPVPAAFLQHEGQGFPKQAPSDA